MFLLTPLNHPAARVFRESFSRSIIICTFVATFCTTLIVYLNLTHWQNQHHVRRHLILFRRTRVHIQWCCQLQKALFARMNFALFTLISLKISPTFVYYCRFLSHTLNCQTFSINLETSFLLLMNLSKY